jgi:hypothetical protein
VHHINPSLTNSLQMTLSKIDLKNLVVPVLLLAGVIFVISCRKTPMKPKIGSCEFGYVLTNDSTGCECPTTTHYLSSDSLYCTEKAEFTYKAKFSQNHCFVALEGIQFKSDDYGFFVINSFNRWYLQLNGKGSHAEELNNVSKGYKFTKLADGRIEIKSGWPVNIGWCELGWESKTKCTLGHAEMYGISDVNNTKMDIRVIYKSACYEGLPLDTAYIYLTK